MHAKLQCTAYLHAQIHQCTLGLEDVKHLSELIILFLFQVFQWNTSILMETCRSLQLIFALIFLTLFNKHQHMLPLQVCFKEIDSYCIHLNVLFKW